MLDEPTLILIRCTSSAFSTRVAIHLALGHMIRYLVADHVYVGYGANTRGDRVFERNQRRLEKGATLLCEHPTPRMIPVC